MELLMLTNQFEWRLRADLLEMKIRLSIFTIIGACAGLPALVWSVSDLIHHRKNGHRISVFIILLLLTDFVELLLSPYILLKYLLNEIWDLNWTFRVLWSLKGMSRDCGILLNQLVALEDMLSMKYPLYTACVFSSPCFISFYMVVFLCIFIFYLTLQHVDGIFNAVLVLIVSVITWIISAGASCSAGRLSHASSKTDHHIVVIFIFTLLVLYLPYIALRIIVFYYFDFIFVKMYAPLLCIPSFLIRMRCISDPLLCVLVHRTSQNPEGTSLV